MIEGSWERRPRIVSRFSGGKDWDLMSGAGDRRMAAASREEPRQDVSEVFPGMARDREALDRMYREIAQTLSDRVRGMAGDDVEDGLPRISEWAEAVPAESDQTMFGQEDGEQSSYYRSYDRVQSVPAPEGMPAKNTAAREFRIGDNQIAQYALRAGFTPEQAVIAVAIALAESGGSTAAVGDAQLRTDKWGSSLGLWQIRSLNAPRPNVAGDANRDFRRLFDPAFNAQSAYAISGSGTNWNPWTVFKTGAYRQHLSRAQQAVNDAMAGSELTERSR
jgi:hypothetical protein